MNERIESMRMTRPPYLIDLEKAEAELTKIHQEYAKKHRSLTYLENILRQGEQIQNKKIKEKQENLSNIARDVAKETHDNMIKGITQDTPNPQRTAIPISDGQIDDDGEYEDEEEVESD